MPIKSKIREEAIKAWIDERVELMFQGLLRALHNAGLKAVTEARKNHSYKDRTGNLTSSIGYVLMDSGNVYSYSGFEPKAVTPNKKENIPGGSGIEGSTAGNELMKKIVGDFKSPNGNMQLILVAGMPYASYVEARGYNVLASAELQAVAEVKEKINDVMQLWQS